MRFSLMSASEDLAKERTELADNRTDWAEDRTVMANERTFAGWMRTGLASVGIGIGFNALFGKLDPAWLARGIATLFIVIGIFIFYAAQQQACAVLKRLQSHSAAPMKHLNMRVIAGAMAVAAVILIIGLWTMN